MAAPQAHVEDTKAMQKSAQHNAKGNNILIDDDGFELVQKKARRKKSAQVKWRPLVIKQPVVNKPKGADQKAQDGPPKPVTIQSNGLPKPTTPHSETGPSGLPGPNTQQRQNQPVGSDSGPANLGPTKLKSVVVSNTFSVLEEVSDPKNGVPNSVSVLNPTNDKDDVIDAYYDGATKMWDYEKDEVEKYYASKVPPPYEVFCKWSKAQVDYMSCLGHGTKLDNVVVKPEKPQTDDEEDVASETEGTARFMKNDII